MTRAKGKTVRVLFVCMGNICRSPMAEAVFRKMVEQAGLSDRIYADSAGTTGYHVGEQPHSGTQRVLQERGISYSHCARVITLDDFARFDYIVPLDRTNMAEIKRMGMGTTVHLKLLLEYAPHLHRSDVPDPYYNGRFEEVYGLIEQGCRGLLEHIIAAERLA